MKGSEFIDALKKKYEIKTDSALADEIGYTQSRIAQIRGQRISLRTILNVTAKVASATLKDRVSGMQPIVEFFHISEDQKSKRSFLNLAKPDQRKLQEFLKKTSGIYAFYNSELEVVYIGKTKNKLWDEMCNAFNRNMKNYKRFFVVHPHNRYSPRKNGLTRGISKKQFYLYDTAEYFSAYSISPEFIDIIERLLIRVLPNDLLNVRIEGNTSWKAYETLVEEA
jgi:hypothetical protein